MRQTFACVMWLAALWAGFGCDPLTEWLADFQAANDEEQSMDLVGRWTKSTSSACSAIYPDELEFFDRGTYLGRKGAEGQDFTLWDAGSYELLDDGRVKISTANDAQIAYDVTIEGDLLTVTDASGCRFQYGRAD